MLPRIKKNSKGLSIIIGYVLLVTIAVAMGAIVYVWLKNFVPTEELKCPDGVSILVSDYSCRGGLFNLTLKNTGKFSIGGYFIRVANDSSQELATMDISQNLSIGGVNTTRAVVFVSGKDNSMPPGDTRLAVFNLAGLGTIYKVEITPVRFQEEKNRINFVSCADAMVRQDLTGCIV